MGKTSFIEDVGKNLDLKYGDKLRIKYITKEILND
jgi:predicted lysophospholipase L1 biosynthesis ABC-type transport system permease subunit